MGGAAAPFVPVALAPPDTVQSVSGMGSRWVVCMITTGCLLRLRSIGAVLLALGTVSARTEDAFPTRSSTTRARGLLFLV